MRIVLVPDSFKGSLDSLAVCRLMAEQPGDAGPVYVVIENQAFWPELFPVLQNYGPDGARPAQ